MNFEIMPRLIHPQLRKLNHPAAALGLCLLLSGCGDDSDTIASRAADDGILIMGNTNEPQGLDPHIVSGVLESNIIRALFEGLCVEHPSQDGVATPGAAERWEHNEDFTEWTFYLQPEGKWSDGKPVTAEDFVFSYHRILSPDLGAKYAEMLYFLENAKLFHQNFRSTLLFRDNQDLPVNVEAMGKPPFRAAEDVELGDLEDQKLADLTEKNDIKIKIAARGLDDLDAKGLARIQQDPGLVKWPESFTPEHQKLVITRLIELDKAGADKLWDLARVGVTAVDDRTLKIRLRGPTPFLPEITKHYTWYPVPKHAVLAHGKMTDRATPWTDPENIVSNGPFILEAWRFNRDIVVKRNPIYWDAATVKLNEIRYLPINNSYTESRMFYDGQMHLTYTVPAELIAYSKENYAEEMRQEAYLGVIFIRCNIKRDGISNLKVRQALSMAIDREIIVDKVMKGGQKPAFGLTPPFQGYKTPDMLYYDLEKAKQLMAEAGYPGGKGFPAVRFLTTQSETFKVLAEALQGMWRKLGITVDIESKEWAIYMNSMETLNYDLVIGGWIGDYTDPTTFLEMWTKGNGNNNTGWDSPEYEALLRKAELTADAAERLKILAEAEALLLTDEPVIPINWYTRNYLKNPRLQGWEPLLLDNHPFKYLYFSPASTTQAKP
jgi:oligopeptide transport system substrate-binding protein